ncbi:MAG: hypothetical protein PHE25_00490 [Candidatus Gracilibacteria bacterium]|nr:hypothetical protein [Candidatus Gracilibacteria bacterium]
MKKIYKDKILNIENTSLFDNKFLFSYLQTNFSFENVEVFFMGELLKQKENSKLLAEIGDKYAIFSNVYSEEDEFNIFKDLFEYALKNNKKIHIIGITLDSEIEMLENYYTELGFLREDINCFRVDFSKPLITTSVNIENLMWRGSDYKREGKNIFFIPPIREAGLTKAMFKGINRGVIASIYIKNLTQSKIDFLRKCLLEEHILTLTLGKVLSYNLEQIGFSGENIEIEIEY